MRRAAGWWMGIVAGLALSAAASEPAAPAKPAGIPEDVARQARVALDRGVRWLVARQHADGHWSNPDFPGLTALALWAVARSGSADTNVTAKAVRYLLSCTHDDGSIWRKPHGKMRGGGLQNYNTAVSMVGLFYSRDPAAIPAVQKAREYIAAAQYLGEGPNRGGMDYSPDNTNRPSADLSNSAWSYEAMRLTESVEDLRRSGERKADLDWAAAAEFVSRIQSLSSEDTPKRQGGFAYRTDLSPAGTSTNVHGEKRLRAYGSMTYAGLLSLIYAQVDRNDPRVKSAFQWAVENWSLDENPGMREQGLYYFFNILSKAMAAYGQDEFKVKDGKNIHWRTEMLRKLISLQRVDADSGEGHWVNEANRWWESDPVLTTAYTLIAIEVALGL